MAPEFSLQSTAMLILASSSPRRQDLLRQARILFKTRSADIPEVPLEGEPPRDFAERMAREKAAVVYRQFPPQAGELILAADTIVVVDGEALGKPANEQDAARMLRLLSGRQHEVTTGVCLMGTAQSGEGGKGAPGAAFVDVRSETTRVEFAEMTQEEIDDYVATGEPMDKAGAYAIQGVASRWIPEIKGCYFNVVGLPVSLVCRMLRQRGAL